MGEVAVDAEGVSFSYGERRALAGIGFSVARGEVHGFLGPNGSGKSTLFKLLATILPLREGKVSVLGADLSRDVSTLRRKLGVVFQSPALDRKLSVRQNLVYGGQMFGLGGASLAKRVDELLEFAGLGDRARDCVGELSGGLRRRAELAKSMLHDPELMLLDEPSTGLDPAARRDLWALLRRREGLTVLFTTHLMDEAAEADRLTILDGGVVVAEGTPAELERGVGGEVLEIECDDPAALAEELRRLHNVEPRVIGHAVRIEHEGAHGLVPALMKTHGERVDKLTLSRPSLADVFLSRTGRRLEEVS